MTESGPPARQDRERRGARLSPTAYDQWFDTPWGRYAFTIELAAIEHAAGRLDGLRVLDAGCGTGRFTAALERGTVRLAGVDLDPAMLSVAARRVRAPLLAADIGALPFRDAAFDVTIAVTVCEFTASPAALVAELARVTRPGGRLVIGALNRRSAWGLARRRQLRRPPWQAARFLTRRQLRALGERHGQVKLHGTLVMPGVIPGSRPAGRFLEAIGRRACPAAGAFQVLTVERAP